MAAQSELTAMKASGISFYRVLRPIILASIIVGGCALLFNETIVPLTDRAADNVMRYEVAKQKPALLKEQMFLKEEKGGKLSRVIYIGKLFPQEGNMDDVLIQEFDSDKLVRIMTAKGGEWKDGEWWLYKRLGRASFQLRKATTDASAVACPGSCQLAGSQKDVGP